LPCLLPADYDHRLLIYERKKKRERETKENERDETKENKVATIYNNIKNMLLSDFTFSYYLL